MTPVQLRQLLSVPKRQIGDAMDWRSDAMPPKWSALPRALPMPRGSEWRALAARSDNQTFIVSALVQPAFGNWKAALILQDGDARRLITRLEEHADHTGLHAHGWCNGVGPPTGAASMDAPIRLPTTRSRHRRSGMVWTRERFWNVACRTFRVTGPASDQGELL